MERKVIHRDRQEIQSADLNNAQDFAQASLDRVVRDGIDPGHKYSGFSVTKTAATEVTVSEGRAYFGGKVYRRAQDTVLDLFNALPLTTQRRVAVVTWGSDQETDVQPRDFLIDVDAGTTEPQSVAMEALRRAELSTVAGTEAPDPTYPTTDASVTVVAYVLLDTSGIVSIEQWSDTQLPNLSKVSDRATMLEKWRTQVSGQVDTLRTDLAALAGRLPGYALMSDLAEVSEALDALRAHVYAPTNSLSYLVDHFLTDETSHTAHTDYDALAEEGVRFPTAAESVGAISLLDPNNVYVSNAGGFILPKFHHSLRLDMTGYDGEERISQHTYETVDIVQKTRTRRRVRYGRSRKVCTNNRWWRGGRFDIASRIFTRRGETWEMVGDGLPDRLPNGARVRGGRVHWVRLRQMFVDTYEEPYWDKVTSTTNISGQQVAQTFLNSQDGWLSQIGLYFSRKAASGDVNVLICETAYGMPDLSKVLSVTNLSHADIQVGGQSGGAGLPSLVETQVPLTPTFLEAGKRYAVVLITAGDHYVAMTEQDNGVIHGTFFASTDGAFFAGNLVKDVKMRLYYAQFERNRLAVEFGALSLSGGISDIDIIAETTIPPTCEIDFEVQVSGQWMPFAPEEEGPDLSGLPDLLPFRAVFLGTTDLMPGIVLPSSQVVVSRPKTAFTWVSEARNLGSAASTIKVIVDLEHFDEVSHDCTISLMTGAALDGTEAADSVEDATLANGGIRRTATFNVTSVSDYAVRIEGTTTNALDNFLVSEMIDYAQT